MLVKGVNDFEDFKNYGQMINASCVIIVDFKANNKKCDENMVEACENLLNRRLIVSAT